MSVLVDWNEFALLLASKLQDQKDETKIFSIFKKLKAIPMTLNILKESKIGKIVNGFRKSSNPYICEEAKDLVLEWKKIAADSSEPGKSSMEINIISKTYKDNKCNINEHQESDNYKKRNGVSKDVRTQNDNNLNHDLKSSRNPFFSEDNTQQPSVKIKSSKSNKEIKSDDTLLYSKKYPNPDLIVPMEELLKPTYSNEVGSHGSNPAASRTPSICSNYKPNPVALRDPTFAYNLTASTTGIGSSNGAHPTVSSIAPHKILVGEASSLRVEPPVALDGDAFFQKSRTRTQVYSGRKQVTPMGQRKVVTLYATCIKVLIENIDSLEYVGGVPGEVLAPVLDKCNPSQLFNLEHFNPKLLEDTDGCWEKHCSREFKGAYNKLQKLRQEDPGAFMQTWRDVYLEELDSREDRLKKITANISASINKTETGPRVKLAFMSGTAKPPRQVLRQQARFTNSISIHKSTSLHKNSKFPQPYSIQSNQKNSADFTKPQTSSNSNSMTGTQRPLNIEIDPETYALPKVAPPIKRSAPMMDKTMKFFKRFKMRR